MKHLKAFGMFWYDFIIGDDWKIAVAVVSALAITGAVMACGAFRWWIAHPVDHPGSSPHPGILRPQPDARRQARTHQNQVAVVPDKATAATTGRVSRPRSTSAM